VRLAGAEARANAPVAWSDHDEVLIVHVPSVKLRFRSGWLLCALDVNRPGAAKASLQIVYFLGRDGQGDDTVASSTINATGTGAAIAEGWGVQLQRVVWDGVLDALEGVLGQVGVKYPGKPLELIGFSGADDRLDVDIKVN
jgi:hypothetical protein